MSREIKSVAVIGGGTMGTGIAGLCAQRGHKVLLLDVSEEAVEKARERILNGRPPAVDEPEKADNITFGTIDADLAQIANYDWICEAVIEDLETKRALFEKMEPLRREGSVISTNTSGIPLRDVTEGLPDSLRRDIAVTHFFNPVKIMRLMELVPGEDTTPDVMDALADFTGGVLGKGVVYAKDTVNFIGNRIGCYWMLSGLHYATHALENGVSMEEIDALMSGPVGLPPTGLYGLIDLIGLDVMDLVGKNLAVNLPDGDAGADFVALPVPIQGMLERGQIGRKAGAGFYRMQKLDDGSRKTEVFDLTAGDWRDFRKAQLDDAHGSLDVLFTDDAAGRFAWQIMGGTLCYAADLIPEIADDVVNIDRAMTWGFAWGQGPFQMLDALGPTRVIEKIEAGGGALPKMLSVLKDAGAETFYRNDGAEFLGRDGNYHQTPPE
ncbi:MAG: 3-hydroxyacyl-CoA dehydrogenase family protein [Rhodospirillaceae bacterium]|nr:3-hydroxyacyl-CoA dehydrogenase family protein [Rhodospirillaceae bacterium]MBT5298164.1 3-hydroxyacyl-CoA dehydrogenase family protein [Rhodospirillaceae bacterium]MBT5512625.1 3-hydroxyacyl-CoA dehydrogenase family protein [Rhodospirillaceae bacterium]MBT6086042.1 3-hydroxyacyl-CoA dehydrogenase family protein [Rhodospirillaceae bacterium]MBT6882502.1 3-hydroxyacyl-CoA dehydrogenase family protein [Rhodospirillaceae bacterium]